MNRNHVIIALFCAVMLSGLAVLSCRSKSGTSRTATVSSAHASALASSAPSGAPLLDATPPGASAHTATATRPPWRTWPVGELITDSHVHITPTPVSVEQTLTVFRESGIGRFVTKSAGPVGSMRYRATLALEQAMKGRMRSFANIDWSGINEPGFIKKQLADLAQAKRDGIVGIKIFKALGLGVRDAQGKLIPVDSPKVAPLFEECGKLGLIMAWHVADPVAFFEPVTPQNERYDELKMAPDWSFHGGDYPTHAQLMEAQERVIRKHPKTVFLLIHFGNNPENLDYVERLLDTYPNVYTDTSARVPEIGRHPVEKVRALFIKHQDRILFGSDFICGPKGSMQLGSVSETEPTVADAKLFYDRHWEYFETNHQQMTHPTASQGNWKINGIGLPPAVLQKLYVTNADKLLFRGEFPKPYVAPTESPASSP